MSGFEKQTDLNIADDGIKSAHFITWLLSLFDPNIHLMKSLKTLQKTICRWKRCQRKHGMRVWKRLWEDFLMGGVYLQVLVGRGSRMGVKFQDGRRGWQAQIHYLWRDDMDMGKTYRTFANSNWKYIYMLACCVDQHYAAKSMWTTDYELVEYPMQTWLQFFQ